jgi:hypothetical protein
MSITVLREHKRQQTEYTRQQKHYLLTSRFNSSTWHENEKYRNKNGKLGCIYCSPEPVSIKIPSDSIMFVLEMNNETNKIMGIGMVRNHSTSGKYNVYENGNYNRYVYAGKHRISRTDMNEEEVEIMELFDHLCFTGNRHMKRGQGLKSFPIDILFRCSKLLDLVNYITEMFKKRMLTQKE